MLLFLLQELLIDCSTHFLLHLCCWSRALYSFTLPPLLCVMSDVVIGFLLFLSSICIITFITQRCKVLFIRIVFPGLFYLKSNFYFAALSALAVLIISSVCFYMCCYVSLGIISVFVN